MVLYLRRSPVRVTFLWAGMNFGDIVFSYWQLSGRLCFQVLFNRVSTAEGREVCHFDLTG